MSRRAGPSLPPTPTIWPPAIPTSPVKTGFPVPSMMLPPRMTISCMSRSRGLRTGIMRPSGRLDNPPPRMPDRRREDRGMDKELIETIAEGVATLTLNRPDRLNALSAPIMEGLLEALPRLAADPAVGSILLTGAGRGFCAGGDVKRMAEGAVVGR